MKVTVNDEAFELADGATVQSVLEHLNLLAAPGIGVERNGDYVERDQFPTTALKPGDRLEVVRFLGGG